MNLQNDFNLRAAIRPSAFARWEPSVQAAQSDDRTISIYDIIGEDWWTGEGITAKRIGGILRSLGKGDITVNINSPGGDMFEGLAIYNQLRAHEGRVTVNIIGIAASAASVIAMAGDEINIGKASFLMIHNCWTVCLGNRHEMLSMADDMAKFDSSMAGIYADVSKLPLADIQSMMDSETYLSGIEAVEMGLATGYLEADVNESEPTKQAAVRRMEAAMRAAGLPRSEAQKIISEFKGSLSESAPQGSLSESAPDLSVAMGIAEDLKSFLGK